MSREAERHCFAIFAGTHSLRSKGRVFLMKTKNILTEDELKARLAQPESRREAFGMVVESYSQQIYWQLRRMVYDHEDASDLTQNTFIKAWEAIEGFRGEAKISTWLYRIAMYEGLNFLKQQQRRDSLQVRPSDDETATYLMSKLESDPYFDADEYERKFQAAILSLPEKQQMVFRLRYYDEMPYEQMSEITGTSVGALKASYHHAAKKIVAQLEGEE